MNTGRRLLNLTENIKEYALLAAYAQRGRESPCQFPPSRANVTEFAEIERCLRQYFDQRHADRAQAFARKAQTFVEEGVVKNRRFFKPDPLLVLAIVVGLAVLVTGVAQGRDIVQKATVSSAVYRPQVASNLLSGGHVGRVREGAFDLGATGTTIGLALREPLALRRALAAGGDPGMGRIVTRGTTLYVTFARRW